MMGSYDIHKWHRAYFTFEATGGGAYKGAYQRGRGYSQHQHSRLKMIGFELLLDIARNNIGKSVAAFCVSCKQRGA